MVRRFNWLLDWNESHPQPLLGLYQVRWTRFLFTTHFHMPDKLCRLRRSMQHSLEVYPRECEILKSFWVVDSRARDLVELYLRIAGQVGPSGEVLPQEQIGIFIRAALPRALLDLSPPGCRRDRQRGDSQSRAMCQHAFIMKKKLPTPEDFAPLPKKSVLVESTDLTKRSRNSSRPRP